MITTKQPTDDMIEVAIVSMEQALEADGEAVPAGSGDFPREPLVFGLAEAQPPVATGATSPRAGADRPAARLVSDARLASATARERASTPSSPRSHASTTISRPSWHAPRRPRDPAALRRLGQELARLEPAVEAFRALEATRAELAGARELRDSADSDDELRAMARDEIDRLEARRGAPARGAQGPAPAARPERRPRRHPRDPGRGRRRGGGPVRGRALPDVPPLRRAAPRSRRRC